jgi:hypothetical protein
MKVASPQPVRLTTINSASEVRHDLVAKEFVLTCLTCGPQGAFAKASSLKKAETMARRHAVFFGHPLRLIYFDRAWGFQPVPDAP